MKHRGGDGGRKTSASPEPDLKTLICDHSVFFDRLVELIPARFYLAPPDDRQPFKFLSKADKNVAREESRKNIKKARRIRLDPDKSSTTLDLLKKSIEIEKHGENSGGDTDPDADAVNARPVPEDRSVTYEELRQRLHSRMEEFRSTRNKPRDETHDFKKNKKRIMKGGESGNWKRKRDEEPAKESKKANLAKGRDRDAPAPADISFGQVKIGGEDEKAGQKKKLSKVQALERAKRLEEAKKDPEKGEKVSKKHSWKAAESRAAGVKVHDESKLLAQSIKRDKKSKQKHAQQWKERVESRDKLRGEKQRTRTENIKERIQQKNTRRIEKREKKLMRPGFEGRKEGYINK